jgi:tRNA A-37 threonylcarbamoyl transferase component Bud32
VFGKLYSKAHLRSDRWYKLGRELLYGRLEDEKPFNTVRRLVQQEDYALRLIRDAGVPSATPFGFVELTPEREYLLVTEFFDGAVELSEATVDDALIDDGLRVIRLLWNAGIAHRDIKPANLMVRAGKILVIDVAFAEVRPTPWRQAVDLANMMLCLALRSDAPRVYERALLQFSVDEISEGFAAARGLALPSQLRRSLRADSRNLHSEFVHLLPGSPQPIKVQRWSPRRVLIWVALAVVVGMLGLNFMNLVTTTEATRAPLDATTIDCAESHSLEALWIQAQSVQTASLVPCVRSLPVGWTFGQAYANSGRSSFTVDHDRAGNASLEVTLTRQCNTRDATEVADDVSGARRFSTSAPDGAPLDETWYDVFPGGCTTIRLRSSSPVPQVNTEVTRQAPAIVGYITRHTLASALAKRTDGRLDLDPT